MTTQCMHYCVTVVLYESATGQDNVIGKHTNNQERGKDSILWTGAVALTSSKTLVSFIGTPLSIRTVVFKA